MVKDRPRYGMSIDVTPDGTITSVMFKLYPDRSIKIISELGPDDIPPEFPSRDEDDHDEEENND